VSVAADTPTVRSPLTIRGRSDCTRARVMPSGYEHLVRERGWSHSEHTRWTVRGLMTELLADPS
jgi:hypothetical protein